ncbi:MAG TPA: dihydrodipicolinate synthase family protein [Candidatus Angelobacter sp.]|jgi:dihydrodipicolinate synthase/N-acetylneuraminate lyase|nr:dihydrodipicolinate synthase family protein [Candidatus Angelobacter sp.]
MLLQGIFPAVTTPFYPDGAVYYKKIEHNIDRYSRTPVAGMVVLGSTGEAVMLSDEERGEVLRVTAEVASPEKVLIAGTGAESVIETLRLTEIAAKLNYDVALVRTPHFYRPQMKPEAMLAFYRTVADRSPLPVLLYTVPPFTAYDLPLEVITALAEHPNIIGIKESSGNVEKVAAMVQATKHIKRSATVTETQQAVTARMLAAPASDESGGQLVSVSQLNGGSEAAVSTRPGIKTRDLKTRTREVGFQVLVGAAHTLLDSLMAGASGGVLGFAAPAPTICFEIHAAWKDNDLELARSKQLGLTPATKRVVSELGIPAIKYAMDLNGYYGGLPRLPLLPPTAAQKNEIESLMAFFQN